MPDALDLPLTIPAEIGPAAAVIAELRDRVRAVELERAAERARTGRRCWVGAWCARSHGAITRRAWRPGGTCGPG